MTYRILLKYAIPLLAAQAVITSAVLFAAQPCVGLTCKSRPALDLHQAVAEKAPDQVSINEVVDHPGDYDGRNIQIVGKIVAIEPGATRRGNMYLALTVAQVNSSAGFSDKTIKIYAFSWPRVEPGDTVTVEGTYRVDYWFGGWPLEHFIDAELIKRKSVI